jgi:hypothetical protein
MKNKTQQTISFLATACLLFLFMFPAGVAAQDDSLSWDQLGDAEKQVLRPFADRWDSLDLEQRQNLQKGARRWSGMSDQERQLARET